MADQFNILDASVADYPDSLATGEESIPRSEVSGSPTMSTGQLRLSYFTARKTEPISQVKVWSSATAAGATPSVVRVGIWRSNTAGDLLELVASTANDTALLATLNTEYTKALSAPFTKQRGMRLACGLLVVTATTAPTVAGSTIGVHNGIYGYGPLRGAGIGGQSDLPGTSTSQAANTNRPYIVLLP